MERVKSSLLVKRKRRSKMYKYAIGVSVLFVVAMTAVWASNRPDTFLVDSKYWECKASEPVGIGARCIKLERKI